MIISVFYYLATHCWSVLGDIYNTQFSFIQFFLKLPLFSPLTCRLVYNLHHWLADLVSNSARLLLCSVKFILVTRCIQV